jgi:8-oxo-dGTP pyrophosphatase MutT (NUDIX family)
MSKDDIEIIARGVLIADDKLLVCHTKGAANTYLPGGHVDFGEDAKSALVREIEEEMGLKASVLKFLGVCEHSFLQNGEQHQEVNLVFCMRIADLDTESEPKSREDYIEFFWQDIGALGESGLEPACLRECLLDWLSDTAECEHWVRGSWPESR